MVPMYDNYMILTATSKDDLTGQVKHAMEADWQPLGGVSVMNVAVAYGEGAKMEFVLAQAMGHLTTS